MEDDVLEAYMQRVGHKFALLEDIPRTVPRARGYRDVIGEMIGENDDYFREHFRISRPVFEQLLDHMRPLIEVFYRGGHEPIQPDHQLFVFLWYLCNQQSMREVSQLFGVSKSTVHGVVRTVCDAILTLQDRVSSLMSICTHT